VLLQTVPQAEISSFFDKNRRVLDTKILQDNFHGAVEILIFTGGGQKMAIYRVRIPDHQKTIMTDTII
jgi:hypothetical protein